MTTSRSDLPPTKESGIERPDLERMISRPDREDWSGQVGTLLVHSEARLARYALSLEAERDALREALGKLEHLPIQVTDEYAYKVTAIARAALERSS